jgi:toxin ParE1/3/4
VGTLRPINLRYSARARSQLIAIQEYINERNPDAAIRVGAAIREAAQFLRYFPYAGRPGQSADTREWVVRRFPYILVYEVNTGEENEIMILGVFHSAQRRD